MISFDAFGDELVKIAGVGIDLHGYHSHLPTYQEMDKEWESGKTDEEAWDRTRAARIKTPHDQESGRWYKAHGHAVLNGGAPDSFFTDHAYSSKPYENRLDRKGLQAFMKHYDEGVGHAVKSWAKNDEEKKNLLEAQQALRKKVNFLLKHPKFQYARVEWE